MLSTVADRTEDAIESAPLILRRPDAEDGVAVNDLVARCKPLDENSVYCNLLQCSHFRETSALAEVDGDVRGFVSGYLLPDSPDTLFVWQVAVDARMRGQSLAKRLMLDILRRPSARTVRNLHTTITSENVPSRKVFSSVAKHLNADVSQEAMFDRTRHFEGEQSSEILWRIGPFARADVLPSISNVA